ncbi:MAG TPA: TPM domain-containing protein [Sphingorhabdus sp.]|nr:TPM domain-containing protein [Sphingorhabdus sp.]
MLRAFALFLATLSVFIGNHASAQDFPKLTGRVVDQADLLSPEQEASLTAKLAGLESQSNRQLVVATIKDLQGYEISDYGYRLGRTWAIGQDGKGESEKDNGAILIVAPNERKMRIEVGYGLEPVLTDGLSSSIIRNDITPFFKAGDFNGGINAGVDRIVTQLTLPPEEAAKVAEEAALAETRSNDDGEAVFLVIFWLFIFLFFILPIIISIARGGKKHRRGRDKHWGGPVIIWGGGGSSWGGGSSGGFGGGGFGGGGFSGGGGSFGGGGASGGW